MHPTNILNGYVTRTQPIMSTIIEEPAFSLQYWRVSLKGKR